MQEQTQTSSSNSSHCLLIVVLLIVLLGAVLYAIAQHGAGSGGSGYSFEQEEAFHLAQATQAERQAHPYGGNYGQGSITVFYPNDTSSRYPSPIYQGYDAPTPPLYRTHSEQKIYQWIVATLPKLRQRRVFDGATAVRIVIFSQVIVCAACRSAMIPWQQTFHTLTGVKVLFVTVWQLTPQKAGFSPKCVPRGKPVTSPDDVQQVMIPFAP